jgi:cytochrome c oxidase cbb3-type subunit I/II
MELERFSYDNKIVKAFIIATVVFGLVGMLVGLTAGHSVGLPHL